MDYWSNMKSSEDKDFRSYDGLAVLSMSGALSARATLTFPSFFGFKHNLAELSTFLVRGNHQ